MREQRSQTRAELATLWNVDISNIAKIEGGHSKSLKQTQLEQLAAYWKMSIAELTAELSGELGDKTKPLPEPLGAGRSAVRPIPEYSDFPFHAGSPTEPVDYIYRDFPKERATSHLEAYPVKGTCLAPIINEGDRIIVDREAAIDNGDIVACRIDGTLHLARLKKIAGELWLENGDGHHRMESCEASAVVIEVIRRLK